MKFVLLALSFLFAAPATAQNFWIPAETFDQYTNERLEGSLTVDDDSGKQVQLLGNDQQVRTKTGVNRNLDQFLDENTSFNVCTLLANYDSGVTNTVLVKHHNHTASKRYTLDSTRDTVICSESASIDESDIQSAGIKVVHPSQGTVQVRGVYYRVAEASANISSRSNGSSSLGDYEFSRAIGYLWADGGVASDGNSLYFRRNSFSTSQHFGSVAQSYFGNALDDNSHDSRYLLELDGISAQRFLADGVPLSSVPDKRAFLTSVIESEGSVSVGRVLDDGNLDRCVYLKTLVDGLNPQCLSLIHI